jgi:hypothetical protein
MMYQVIVAYQVTTWYAPYEDADAARERYAIECLRIARDNVRCVLLTRSGVIVAQATC